jgi:hypothetical protein
MPQKTYHGQIAPEDISRSLMAHFNRGNFRVQQVGTGSNLAVQIATREAIQSGGQTALSVTIQKIEDGVSVDVGTQAWIGVAASLGWSAITALRNPLSLLSRIDDIAQDIESLTLVDEIWKVVDAAAESLNSGFQISDRLRRLVCSYCGVANPVGEPRCISCGAPLGDVQPDSCDKCGFVTTRAEKYCPNCGALLNRNNP